MQIKSKIAEAAIVGVAAITLTACAGLPDTSFGGTFITSIGALVTDADLAKARTVCESQGWVGTP